MPLVPNSMTKAPAATSPAASFVLTGLFFTE
jgi:hypothetical protein